MAKKICTYKYTSGPYAGNRCKRTVYAAHICGPHYRAAERGTNMDEVSPIPRAYTRRTRNAPDRDKLKEKLDQLASVLKISRTQLEQRILSDWLQKLNQ